MTQAAYDGAVFLQDAMRTVETYRKSIRADFGGIPEARMWERPVPGQVSAANLVLHLTGNLRHFFGHELGGSGYRRERDREFEDRSGPGQKEILEAWDAACAETVEVLGGLDPGRLTHPAPAGSFRDDPPVHRYIVHLITHLTYHAGQIRSLYRMLAPNP